MLQVNFIAVIVAALSAFILGFLFHGPLFGKLWMKLANIHPTGNEKLSDMIPQLLWNFLVNFITAYVLAVIYLYASTSPLLAGSDLSKGIVCALWVWLGFMATTTSIEVIWMGRNIKLWLFETVCSLVIMIVMGGIISVW